MAKTKKPASVVPAGKKGQSNQPVSGQDDIGAFLEKVRSMPPATKPGEGGRLIFAMDATMSRQPTWDRAQHLQAEMFEETAKIGGLDVQLIYFRGVAFYRVPVGFYGFLVALPGFVFIFPGLAGYAFTAQRPIDAKH